MKKVPVVVLLLFSLWTTCAAAAAEDSGPQEGNGAHSIDPITVVVTANRMETPAEEVGSSVTVITADQIEKMQKTSVIDVLRTAPALDINQSGGPGAAASIFIRGAKSEHTLVIIDGIEANDPITPGRTYNFAHLSVDNIERMPGVEAVAAIEGVPLAWFHGTTVTVPGRPDEDYPVQRRHLTPGYFQALRIPLLAGRDVRETDGADAPRVIVVNETLARRFFPGEDAVGKHIAWDGPTQAEDLEIVGVVGDVRAFGLNEEVQATIYLPNRQIQTPSSMCLVIRTAADPQSLVRDVRQAVWRLDDSLPLYEVATMEQKLSDSLASQRSWLLLLSFFAAVALLLAAVGTYGVLSYTVSQRIQELGVRMAMGAGRMTVLGLVTRQGMTLVLLGVALGLAGAVALSRLISGLLYEVGATDPATFAAVAAFIISVALPACYIPARRAASVDPLEALRYE